MISPDRIAEVLGLKKGRVRSLADLSAAVHKGLPKAALRSVVIRIIDDKATQRALLIKVIPEATLKRRRDLLKPDESERTERLARVIATAEFVWNDEMDARAFLTSAHSLLGGKRPIEVALTELGARQVEEILWRLYYGISA